MGRGRDVINGISMIGNNFARATAQTNLNSQTVSGIHKSIDSSYVVGTIETT